MARMLALAFNLQLSYVRPTSLQMLYKPIRGAPVLSVERGAIILEDVPPQGPRAVRSLKRTWGTLTRARAALRRIVITTERLATAR
jgi:hypothetical protein